MAFKYEVVDHGCDHAQYFPGAGVAFTKFDHIVTGAGPSARDAAADALEQFYMTISDVDKAKVSTFDLDSLGGACLLSEEEDAHKGCDPNNHEECEWWHYVSIRWAFTQDA